MVKKWTIKKKLLFSTSVLIFVSVMIVTIISSRNYKKDMIDLSYSDTKITLQQLAYNIDSYLQNIQELCILPYYDDTLINSLSTHPTIPSAILSKQRNIENFLSKNILLPNEDIEGVYIFSNQEVYSSKRTQKYLSYSNLDDDMIKKVSSSKVPIIIYPETENANFIILSNILDIEDNSKTLGILRIDVNTKGLDKICSKVLDTEDKGLIIANEKDEFIYGSSKCYPTSYLIEMYNKLKMGSYNNNILNFDSFDFLITSVQIPFTSWTIYDVSNLQSMTKGINEIQTRSIILGLICATIGILLSTQLVKRLLKPIYEVTDLMKKVQGEDYSVKAKVIGDDEIAYLSSTFNEMTEKIETTMKKNILLTQKIYEAKYLEKEAQYVAMCNQIKPHFLFNSLNTISLLIKVNRKEESIDYIEKLASLLNGLVHADSEITLRSELLICKNYLSMQCIRYTNLNYEINVDDKVLNYLIPALTIQPIIENALIHGFSRKEDKCLININVSEKKENLSIIIRDNGVGIEKEKLKEIKEKIENPNSEYLSSNKRVALINIQRRIKLKYGEKYGLSISSVIKEGSVFTLTIPKILGE